MKVKSIIKLIESDNWYLARIRGSHRQYKHEIKTGLVTVSGKPSDELAPGAQNNIIKQAGVKEMKYLIVVEKTKTGYSAYSPDIDGCIATGATQAGVEKNMQEAIEFHLEGLALEKQTIPQPHSYSNYLEVTA